MSDLFGPRVESPLDSRKRVLAEHAVAGLGRWEALVASVRNLHSPRRFLGDGYNWTVCAECRQAWPCATEQAMAKALGE